jgi:hypothetical protein
MSTLHYELSVPDDGIVVLPPEFCGSKVVVINKNDNEKVSEIIQADKEFRQQKSLDEILKVQNAKPIRSIDDLRRNEQVWESEKEFFDFLEAIGENIDLYR